MGWRDKKYSISLKEAMYRKLSGMFVPGKKKKQFKMTREYKENGFEGKIFSARTYHTYKQHVDDFGDWMQENYPEVTTMRKAKRHVKEFLEIRVKELPAAHSIQTCAAALNKLFDIKPEDDDYFLTPPRIRENFKRSRGTKKSDKNFSRENHEELINFADATGLRYAGMKRIKGRDLYTADDLKEMLEKYKKTSHNAESRKQIKMIEDALKLLEVPGAYFFIHTKEKGAKERYALVVGEYTADVVDRFMHTKQDQHVWLYVPKNADIHGERHKYVGAFYKSIAREVEDIPYDKINKGTGKKYQSEVYNCRGERKGLKLDKHAMKLVSLSVGHNRLDVIANSYFSTI